MKLEPRVHVLHSNPYFIIPYCWNPVLIDSSRLVQITDLCSKWFWGKKSQSAHKAKQAHILNPHVFFLHLHLDQAAILYLDSTCQRMQKWVRWLNPCEGIGCIPSNSGLVKKAYSVHICFWQNVQDIAALLFVKQPNKCLWCLCTLPGSLN